MGGLLARAVATFGFIGLLPLAPATWASAVTLLFWYYLPPAGGLTLIVLWVVLIFGGTLAAHRAESYYGHDGKPVVIDEVAGSLLAVAGLTPGVGIAVAAFLLVRIFDILKPPPIYQLQALHGGFGVMADDIAAGLLANVVLRLCILWVPGLAEVLL